MSSILPFQLVFAFKGTSDSQKIQEDEEVKHQVTSQLWSQAAEFCDIGI